MIYFDAAYLAKFYLDEPDSDAVRALAEGAGEIACALHGRVEVLTVFHRKLRERAISTRVFAILCEQFQADCDAGLWEWLPLSPALIATLADRIAQLPASVFLRAADALHLISAAERNLGEIYSNDRHLLAAASHFGLRGRSV
ncbi:MAG: type II toxin-antitoxin system VapC family toxin [Chthoniobacterales bacterium]|nr:type II toxin-antitoxin system VapC family toxin [Chthoniobacterales bacterium]